MSPSSASTRTRCRLLTSPCNQNDAWKSAVRVLLPHADVGSRLVACFVAGGPASPVWRWLALTYRCMLPHMVRLRLTLADTGDPDTFADRLVAAATAVRSQIVSIPQACAWAIRP